jgi:hypothetical protein
MCQAKRNGDGLAKLKSKKARIGITLPESMLYSIDKTERA